jgi:hypothetical protein
MSKVDADKDRTVKESSLTVPCSTFSTNHTNSNFPLLSHTKVSLAPKTTTKIIPDKIKVNKQIRI